MYSCGENRIYTLNAQYKICRIVHARHVDTIWNVQTKLLYFFPSIFTIIRLARTRGVHVDADDVADDVLLHLMRACVSFIHNIDKSRLDYEPYSMIPVENLLMHFGYQRKKPMSSARIHSAAHVDFNLICVGRLIENRFTHHHCLHIHSTCDASTHNLKDVGNPNRN